MKINKLIETYDIPVFENEIAIGFFIDLKSQQETVFLGDLEDLKEMICVGSSSNVFKVKSRKLGTLFNDIENSISSEILKNVINGFNHVLKNGWGNKDSKPFLEELDNIYKTTSDDNIVTSYIISYIYNNFIKLHNKQNDKLSLLSPKKYFEQFSSEFNKTVDNLLQSSKNIPIISSNNASMIKFEDVTSADNFTDLKVFPKRSRGSWNLYYLSTGSLLPLFHTYYDQLKAAKLFIRNCTICNKIVVLKKVNNYVVCNDEKCQNARNINAVKKSRSKIVNGTLRSLYTNFYGSINFARNYYLNENSRIDFDSQFKRFCKEALIKKKDLELESSMESDNYSYQIYSEYLKNAEVSFKKQIHKLKAGEYNG